MLSTSNTTRAAKRVLLRQAPQAPAGTSSPAVATTSYAYTQRRNKASAASPALSVAASTSASALASKSRSYATVVPGSAPSIIQNARTHAYKVVVIGGGAAGQAVSHQIARSGVLPIGGNISKADILVIDPAEWHDYQPGWTLVGAGLKRKEELRRPMKELLTPSNAAEGEDQSPIDHLQDAVVSFDPEKNQLKTRDGRTVQYEQLVVCPGIHINWGGIEGLQEALKDSKQSKVASIYSYDTCSELFPLISSLDKGRAIFTQPSSVIKCAGAPQKAMWLALDHWKSHGLFSPSDAKTGVQVSFITGMPTMFAQPKYNKVLDDLRKERQVEGLFNHNLTKIDVGKKVATFAAPEGKSVEREYDLLHVTPPMGPLPWIKASPLAAADSGFVDVDAATTQHKKFKNVWSIGDSSTLPTSKTAAAIAAEAPVLVANLLQALQGKNETVAQYDGYTSCPLLTEYGKVLLAEFQGPGYGGQPKETFGRLLGIDQSVPNRFFYHLKKDFFPWVYYSSHVKGTWQGPKGFLNPQKLAGPQQRSFHSGARRTLISSSNGRVAQRSFSTSTAARRNLPARRPKDPLDNDPTARRHRLPTGETFIIRTPPSAPSQYTTTLQPNPILNGFAPLSPGSKGKVLPPPLKPNSKTAPAGAAPLTEEQILQIQALRRQNPNRYTASKLAAKFGCSPTFVRIAAPVSKEAREQRDASLAAIRNGWSLRKRISRIERAERRKFW